MRPKTAFLQHFDVPKWREVRCEKIDEAIDGNSRIAGRLALDEGLQKLNNFRLLVTRESKDWRHRLL